MLRGVYETALLYGFDYETPGEKIFILKLLEAGEMKMVSDEICAIEISETLFTQEKVNE